MKTKNLLIGLIALALLSGCAAKSLPTLTVITHDSFSISASVVAAFEQANQVKVVFLKGGDTGMALNKVILSRGAPLADVFFGVDNNFLSRALEVGIYEPYTSPLLADIPAELQLDPTHNALPVDYGDICINYDKAWFATHSLPLPSTLDDLLKPEYQNLLVVENPAISSPGLGFLLATLAQYGDPGYLQFWQALKANGVVVVDDWNTAYYTHFSGSSGHGAQPMVVSYATSPAAEAYYADPPVQEAPTASIISAGTCFRQVEFVGILKGTPNRQLAEKLVDYMLGRQFQEDIPWQDFMVPANSQAQLPPAFVQWSQLAVDPVRMTPEEISANRERWVTDWTAQMLH